MLVGRKGLSPVMVGRQAELSRLTGLAGLLTAPQSTGEPEVAFVAGEAGVGKTRLTSELLAALPHGTTVLAASAGQGGLGRPFQLLLDAVEPAVSQWKELPAALQPRDDPACLLLAPVAPTLMPCADRDYGREELLRTAVEVVRHLVGDDLGAVVFDDLHWADAESVALFGRLATAPNLPVLLIGSYRPEELNRTHPLAELLAELERRRTVHHIALGRLAQHEVGDLLAAVYRRPVPFHAVEALHRRTGGNPFFVEELLMAAGEADPEQLPSLPLPWNLTEAVLRHVDSLPPEQRRVLEAAAVLGQRITFDLLATLTGLTEEDMIDALRLLVHAGGLLVEEEPDIFAFRHALTREAVLGQLLGRERRRLHEKALVAMQEMGSDDYLALAHHAEGAARFDEMVDAARAGAARYLRQGSTFQALRLAELGLSECDDDLELRRLAAEAAWSVGLLDTAERHANRWRAIAAERGDRSAEGAALRHLARVYTEEGDRTRQWDAVETALELAEPLGPSEDLAAAQVLRSEYHMFQQESEEAIVWADRALAMIDEIGLPALRPRALVNKGSALAQMASRGEEGAVLLEQAIAEAVALDDVFNHSRALSNLLSYRIGEWQFAESRRVLDEVIAMAERGGRSGAPVSVWATFSAELATMEGDQAAARRFLDEGRRRDPGALVGAEGLWYIAIEIELTLESGDVDGAARLLADRPAGSLPRAEKGEPWFHALAAEIAVRRGDLTAAGTHLRDAIDTSRATTTEPVRRAILASLRIGLPPAEARALVASLPDAAGCTHIDLPVWTDHLEGAILEAEHDAEAALAAYQRALAVPRHRPAYLAADVHAGAARCLIALGQVDEARAEAEAAAAKLERWPGWRRDDLQTLLRRLRVAGAAHSSELTPREREVAALIAEGCSNGEIARRLYISTKTASVHVSNILMKLGMSSRTEVAAWFVRLGLDGSASEPQQRVEADG